jgi:hypothetical protein
LKKETLTAVLLYSDESKKVAGACARAIDVVAAKAESHTVPCNTIQPTSNTITSVGPPC